MAEQSVQKYPPEPKFITYLLSQKHQHDCYFIVGNNSIGKTERLGVVKKMLMAHSPVLRIQLEESELAEKGDVPVKDLDPDTFKNLLRYVYGYDNISALCFDDADNLLYAAEKYLMQDLKDKLVVRLMGLLTTDNICSLFYNHAIFAALELNSAFTKILQNETDKVLASPLFLDLSPDAFTKILEQEALNVPEVEVWKAAVKWAKHRTGSEDGQILRRELSKPSQHIHICTLSHEDFSQEVVPARVLTYDEVVSVCLYHTKREVPNDLGGFSLETVCRKRSRNKQCEMSFPDHMEKNHPKYYSCFDILTKESDVELLSMKFRATPFGNKRIPLIMFPKNSTYLCNCTITVKRITDYANRNFTETPVTIRFCQQVDCIKDFDVPITNKGANMILLSNQLYNVTVSFTEPHKMGCTSTDHAYSNEHCSVGNFHCAEEYVSVPEQFMCPMASLLYRPLYTE